MKQKAKNYVVMCLYLNKKKKTQMNNLIKQLDKQLEFIQSYLAFLLANNIYVVDLKLKMYIFRYFLDVNSYHI